MNDNTYNGWANFQTWVFKLWIDNNEGLSHAMKEAVVLVAGFAATDNKPAFEGMVARMLDEWLGEQNPLYDEASLWGDLMQTAIEEIDTLEVAKHLVEEYFNDLEADN